MLMLKSDDELAVTDEDVMLSLPVPKYIARRFGRLYRMNYEPHITLAMGKKLPNTQQLAAIKEDLSRIKPFKITFDSLTVMPTEQGNMLWANAHIPPEVQYLMETEMPYWNLYLNSEFPGSPWPHTPYNFRPHVTLRYRKRPFRWLPQFIKSTWTQRWVELVKGDTVVERFVLSERFEDKENRILHSGHGE